MEHFSNNTSFLILSVILFLLSCAENKMPLSTENSAETESITLESMDANNSNVVFVAPPSGDSETDRASIEAAVAQAEPGDIIQFSQGTYVIGSDVSWDGILVDVPNTTLQGHPGGTTLKGGDNITTQGQYLGFTLTGGNQTVRNLTFESFSWTSLYLNYSLYAETGGYVVEHNIFRNSTVGIMYLGQSEEVSHIKHNVFDNIGTSFWIYGKTCHIKGNKVLASDPDKVPFWGYPANVGGISAWFTPCDNNVIAYNTIDGISDGIILSAFYAVTENASCSNNRVVGNKFLNQKIYKEWDLGTMVILDSKTDNKFENNQISHNTYLGSGGIGILTFGISNTTIANNTITNTSVLSSPYFPSGYGIFLGEESHHNQLLHNKFTNNELYDIILYGDNNTIITGIGSNKIQDNGEGNIIMGRGFRKAKSLNKAQLTVQTSFKKLQQIRQLTKELIESPEGIIEK